jgi:MoxR-like ATPase
VPLQFAFGNSNQLSKKERTNSKAQVDRFMLKTVIDYLKWMKSAVVRQNLKGSYEKVNQVVSVEQILRAQKRFVKYTWMRKIEIHS